MTNFILKSKRLGLRNWQEQDEKPFIEMGQDPAVMKFFPKLLSPQESKDFIQLVQERQINEGFTWWAAEYLDTKEFMGFIGFKTMSFESDLGTGIEIGWRLRSKFWGQGLASEGAKAALGYGFNELRFKEVYSFTPKLNKASERVMQKIAMYKVGEFAHPMIEPQDPLCQHVQYCISSEDYFSGLT